MSVRGVISRADKRSGNQADKVYKKRLPHESRKSETAFCVQSLFFCFVKVMENKTGTSAFFSIAMKVEVWLCICLHGKDAAKMF